MEKNRYRYFLMTAMIMVLFCGCKKEELQNRESIVQNVSDMPSDLTLDLPEGTSGAVEVSDEKNSDREELERFGEYLEGLLQERNLKELEQYKISRLLPWREAAGMADSSPALKHFGAYGQYRFSSDGVVLLEADVNGDGRKDIVEYLPRIWDSVDASFTNVSRLTVYVSDASGDYRVLYFSPDFPASLGCNHDIYMVGYGRNTYLIFYFVPNGAGITAFQMQDGIPTGEIRIDYERTDVDYEVAYCKSGMEESVEKLREKREEYYPVSVAMDREKFRGDAGEVTMETPEYGVFEELGYEDAEGYKNRYRELLGTDRMVFSTPIYLSGLTVYQSDLDNDSEPELYAMDSDYLGMGVLDASSRCRYIYPTGELYGDGKHEGEWGLQYVMADGMQLTDFEQLCGLDIWASDYVPQVFWVEKCGDENITFIKYFAGDYLDCLIEGYCIKDGGYETVLSVEYHPMISTVVTYEWPKEGKEALTYTVHLLENEDVRYPVPVIYGLPDGKLQDGINAEMERLLYGEIEKFLYDEMEKLRQWWDEERQVLVGGGGLTVQSATSENLNLLCGIYYEYKDADGKYQYEEHELYCLDIDLTSGKVGLSRVPEDGSAQP